MHLTTNTARQSAERESSWQPDTPEQGRVGARDELALELCEGMIDIVAALFSVSSKDLRRPGRPSLSVGRVRQIAMYVAHVVLRLSMADIGRGFGRDRTTVIYACHVIEDLRDDQDFDRIITVTEQVALAAFRNRLGL